MPHARRNPHRPSICAALLAVEVEPRVWEGFWTFDPSLVGDLNAHIGREL